MAEMTWYTERTVRRVWELPSPTNGAEVRKVFVDIEQTLKSEGMADRLSYDNTVVVEAADDVIRFVVDMGTIRSQDLTQVRVMS